MTYRSDLTNYFSGRHTAALSNAEKRQEGNMTNRSEARLGRDEKGNRIPDRVLDRRARSIAGLIGMKLDLE